MTLFYSLLFVKSKCISRGPSLRTFRIESSKVEKKYSDGTIVVSHSSHQTMNLNNVSYYRCELSNEESEPVLPALSHLEQLV